VPATEDADDQAGPAAGEAGRADQRDATAITVLAVTLTLGTGATDVASFTRLGDVFTSVMTGNLVLLGLAVGRLSGSLATHAVVALAGYLVGAAAGARLVQGTRLMRPGGTRLCRRRCSWSLCCWRASPSDGS
jgi:hypothetical protein